MSGCCSKRPFNLGCLGGVRKLTFRDKANFETASYVPILVGCRRPTRHPRLNTLLWIDGARHFD